tara:strand:+ start:1713 stop:2117 length:405 start_codon:yes stop_codon:yes gene_type:complete
MKTPDDIPVYGDLSYRGKCPTEELEQVTFFNKLRREHPEWGAIAIHIKNEGKRTKYQADKDSINGMVTGASDIIIPASPAFICELKRKDHTKSRISEEQINYLRAARDRGAFICVALGYEAAFQAFYDYLQKHY